MMVKCADGVARDLFPVGARVRHKKHPTLTGVIKNQEMSKPGVHSPLPYKIYWDDDDAALKLLGNMYLYPAHENLEPI